MDLCLFLQVSHFGFLEHILKLFGRSDDLVGFVEDGDILCYCGCHFEGGVVRDLVPVKLTKLFDYVSGKQVADGLQRICK